MISSPLHLGRCPTIEGHRLDWEGVRVRHGSALRADALRGQDWAEPAGYRFCVVAARVSDGHRARAVRRHGERACKLPELTRRLPTWLLVDWSGLGCYDGQRSRGLRAGKGCDGEGVVVVFFWAKLSDV